MQSIREKAECFGPLPAFNEPARLRDLVIECFGFSLFYFWVSAKRVVKPETAKEIKRILLDKVFERLVTSAGGHGDLFDGTIDTLSEYYDLLDARIEMLSNCPTLFVGQLEAGWRESSGGNHCMRLAEILGLDTLTPSRMLVETLCSVYIVTLAESNLFQKIVSQTAWK